MRGKAKRHAVRLTECGITPAYAGKSAQITSLSRFLWDHPRLCGEKKRQQGRAEIRVGSPPPMRGKDGVKQYTADRVGITPAYAGKSRGVGSTTVSCKDHPRLCGEKTKKIPKQRYFFHQPASFSFSLQYT